MSYSTSTSIQKISVIVPTNPFLSEPLQKKQHCLCALNVEKLMDWWPGTPHMPIKRPEKVKAIQRSLDWKRVVQIAAYLLQREIEDAPDIIKKYFSEIYEPKQNEPGRQWPPKIGSVIGFQRSGFQTFSNVLIHINGADIIEVEIQKKLLSATKHKTEKAAELIFDENDPNVIFSVIDGQHRINGAYLAIQILKESKPDAKWEIPAEVFIELDPPGSTSKQAQIFIDVNSNQKKVDKSLVADLFPTARDGRISLDNKERAQDLGRKLMLEKGPLIGMIQIPGVKYGVKDVITLATLNTAIESILNSIILVGITTLESQSDFLSQCLEAWLLASGRFENINNKNKKELEPENVVYQSRVLVGALTLVPATIWKLQKYHVDLISDEALQKTTKWFKDIMSNADLLENGIFISKSKFKDKHYLGTGGAARFRDTLWATIIGNRPLKRMSDKKIAAIAEKNRNMVFNDLSISGK